MINETEKPEFWEKSFIEKQEMWGFEPSKSAVLTKDFFVEKSVKNVLIPGIGYGRNAQIFRDSGIVVTGIEISKTAIEMAQKHYGTDMTIYHGSVTDMPFDQNQYDGIFCYALIHLLDSSERKKLIADCYNQLTDKGHMVFTAISKEAPTYGHGKFISEDRYEIFDGVNMFFYDRESINAEFGAAGLFEIAEVTENYPFFLIKCRRADQRSELIGITVTLDHEKNPWVVFLLLISSVAFAQKAIKAMDARKYIGKKVTIIGTIKSIAGPGYLTSMSFYLVTDSADVGMEVIVPMKIWGKSKMFNENQKGKVMKVTGLIKLNGEPYTEVENKSDVKIMD